MSHLQARQQITRQPRRNRNDTSHVHYLSKKNENQVPVQLTTATYQIAPNSIRKEIQNKYLCHSKGILSLKSVLFIKCRILPSLSSQDIHYRNKK